MTDFLFSSQGNHRDSWVFGAADAASGTAAMLEVAKGLYTLKQTYLPLLDFFHSLNVSLNLSLFSFAVKWLATP